MPFANDCLQSGYSSLRDVPSVEVDQCTLGSSTLQLRDPNTGVPIDLTQYQPEGSSSSSGDIDEIRVRIKELPEDHNVWAEMKAEIVDPATNGTITFDYNEHITRQGGIYTAEVQFWKNSHLRRVAPFFFIVNPDLASDDGAQLTIAEIRMSIRDIDPEGNFLLDQLEFSRQEIALCMRRCIDYWNEVPPPIAFYKPTNFPYRYHYSRAVVSQLYFMSAQHKLRNDLSYSAGGVTVQDTLNYTKYQEMADKLWAEWMQWVKDTKYNLNVMGAFAVLGGYRRYEYYR